MILRLGTVYGLHLDLVMTCYKSFFRLIINKKQITIAGGNQWRPFVHVKDVGRAIIKILNSDFKKTDNQIFNIVGKIYKLKI